MKRIACISQKGGVGKSTLARDISVQFAANGWDVRIADLDDRQTTTMMWQQKRDDGLIKPTVHVYGCKNAETAISVSGCDLVVFDGKPYSDADTRKIAQMSDLIVIPTGPTLDDLHPQILLAHELQKIRIPQQRILFVLNSVASEIDGTEVKAAKEYITEAGYRCAKAVLPRRTAYGQAQNIGKSISEVTHPTLRAQAIGVVQEIGEFINKEAAAA